MKKQVMFAESQTGQRLRQDEALLRCTGMNESTMALKDARVNFNSGVKINRPPADRCEPQLQHETTVRITKTMTAAPFLKHTTLTPAQKEYLYTIAASYSTAHVRNLITQHYMNVLHRCVRTGYNLEGEDLVGTSVTFLETDESVKHRSEVPSGGKHKQKINTSARNPGKSQIPNSACNTVPLTSRLSNTSASKQRKKLTTTSPTLTTKSPRRARIREEEEEEEEEGLDVSLSECVSSVSIGEWDEDALSDSQHIH